MTLERWILIAIKFILTHGRFPGWRAQYRHREPFVGCLRWGCRPSRSLKSLARCLLPCCLGELDRCKNETALEDVISHQHDMSEREGGGPRYTSRILGNGDLGSCNLYTPTKWIHHYSLAVLSDVKWTLSPQLRWYHLNDHPFKMNFWDSGPMQSCHRGFFSFPCAPVARNHTK